jgi:hypothetical protein
MRLINIHTLQFKNFTQEPPPYAIASHRWCAHETTHQDVRDVRNVDSAGFEKVKNFGKAILSVNDTVQSSAAWAAMGFHLKCDWLWIDTACIDRKDLSELSESINSMFRWYRSAAVCYAYLADVGPMSFHYGAMMDFMRSEWFDRGWTLQELLAPGVVVFLAKDWSVIGHKCPYDKPLCDAICRGFGQRLDFIISRITKVPLDVIRNYSNARYISVKARMSWVGTRKTTRLEDMAYCLLGICDVFMSPIYGEGSYAWKRLLAVVEMAENEEVTTCISKALKGNDSDKKMVATTVSRPHVVLPERKPHLSITPAYVADYARKESLSISVDPCPPMFFSSEIVSPSRERDYTNYISGVVPSRTVAGLRDRSQIIWDATVDVVSVPRSHTVNGPSAVLSVANSGMSSSGSSLGPVRLDFSIQRHNERSALFVATPKPSSLGPVLEPKDLRAWVHLQDFSATTTIRCAECYKQIYTNRVVKCNNRYCSNPVFHQFCSGPTAASEHESTWICEECNESLTASTTIKIPQHRLSHHGQTCDPKDLRLAIEQAALECRTEFEETCCPNQLISSRVEEASPTPKILSSSPSCHSLERINADPSIGGEHTDLDPQDDIMEIPDNEVGLLKMALSDATRSDEELKRIWSLLQELTNEKTRHCNDTASELESEQNAVSDADNIEPALSQYHNPWDDVPSCLESKACPQRDLAHTLGEGVDQTDDLAYKYGQIDDAVSHNDVLCGNPWAD